MYSRQIIQERTIEQKIQTGESIIKKKQEGKIREKVEEIFMRKISTLSGKIRELREGYKLREKVEKLEKELTRIKNTRKLDRNEGAERIDAQGRI